MNDYLLDTHYLIWWTEANARKLGKAKAFIETNRCYASPVSIWEMRQKERSSALRLPMNDLMNDFVQAGIVEVPLISQHVETAFALNDLHSDMHDRLLVATAKVSGLTLVTRDAQILERAAKHLRGRLMEI
jgi:PIN domain nuclease of toxin-antitoxin system